MFSYTWMMNMYIESDNHYFSLFIQASFNSDFHALPFSSVFQTTCFFFFCWFAVNLLSPAILIYPILQTCLNSWMMSLLDLWPPVLIFSDPWLGSLFSYLFFLFFHQLSRKFVHIFSLDIAVNLHSNSPPRMCLFVDHRRMANKA